MSSLKGDKTPYARLCHIVKWDDFDGYGFNLHAEKGKNGQYIGKVDEGSPSQAAGLKQGDRIIEVNEINIANETHKQVVERIKAFPNETKLLVLDHEADEYFRANNVIVKGTMANVKVIKTPERNPNSVDHEEGSDHGISADENARKSTGSNDTEHSDSTATTVNASTIAMTTTTTMMTTTASSTTMSSLSSENEETSIARENGSTKSRNSETTEAHVHGTGNGTVAGNNEPRQGLNLKMSAKELRAQLAARKKYDPKKESIGFKDKFDIVQKL
ncbi:Na(+)/H(+) exchange regulatory cofactor-like protein nrfl-1 [Vespa mandarinia]|uniref:Na(+)/H(+) exchange regulatory cofactor-like protein nrfl-1 n=1 Tax=Vespa mandarinia TaxID=7446 RepID=UPI00162301DA|nr:Na(+)/H(+) exchange regulatory cofactor-like protein nrfl-1 [Vespa mandarinia]XP_035739124.1 Na(+)/H(+) exchange regulatory cofactor-like protein nrfl-1 [Vespa mandarinia]